MPRLVDEPVRIPVPGGKLIDEYVGRAATGSEGVSVAKMSAPPGWSEPAQTPEFDEVTLVLTGSVTVEHEGGPTVVRAGQALVTHAGERVRYLVGDEGATYVAVCLPAVRPGPRAPGRRLSSRRRAVACAGAFHRR